MASNKPSVYIAGRMTGVLSYNYPAFFAEAEKWRQAGWDVTNPAEHFCGVTTLPREVYLRRAFRTLCLCHAIRLLPGWKESRGARMELRMARAMGLRVFKPDHSIVPPSECPPAEGTNHVAQVLSDEACCAAQDAGTCGTGECGACAIDEPHRSWSTGAVRDQDDGKGAMHLLPFEALNVVALHSKKGASHYGARNWEKGIPLYVYMDSAGRHWSQWCSGYKDEDHLAAAAWNLLSAIATRERVKMGRMPAECGMTTMPKETA